MSLGPTLPGVNDITSNRTVRLCSEIPIPSSYWGMNIADQPSFVDIPNLKTVNIGDSVCVRVVVTESEYKPSMVYMPVPNSPWDSVLLDLVGTSTGISIPVHLQMSPHVNNYQPGVAHVYEADVVLRDVDVYIPEGYIEFRNGQWNAEGNATLPLLIPEKIFIAEELKVNVADVDGTSKYSLQRYMELPLCRSMDMEGRWIQKEVLPFHRVLVPAADNHGRVWLPYHCRLRRIAYAEFGKCLVQRHPMLHWFGDSNTRRALKKITSLGEWCARSEEKDQRFCMCEDYLQPFNRFNEHSREVFIDMDPVAGGIMPSGWFYPTIAPANKSRIIAFKMEGVTHINIPPWQERFNLGITQKYGTPNTVIISLVNWDMAMSTMAAFAIELDKLIEHISKSYPNSTELIIRTGQYFSGPTDQSPTKRKFSRMRGILMNKYVENAFKLKFGHSRAIRVWDVAAIAERRPIIARKEASMCISNHARAEMVEIENQILFNGLCN
ncbi:hypothetical protein COEREDRAFT_81894 [Coemansia reversa NRRL 1564]|uniref:Uncharacterized protein n=1 Tax=Coemansia reversa (strain ATCC 12441 / NRRL 1564) TaxID=763665 RepID=A0A2G5B974_COERN|nr:hypothetical protein COEREDRAFT_81894 [Coemansia reversa NRRL 1564]|eukprot:PIA15566.1 hypothetical protein COEREDRAFT_81894 [Coemansia reversa NRRL 1564]